MRGFLFAAAALGPCPHPRMPMGVCEGGMLMQPGKWQKGRGRGQPRELSKEGEEKQGLTGGTQGGRLSREPGTLTAHYSWFKLGQGREAGPHF